MWLFEFTPVTKLKSAPPHIYLNSDILWNNFAGFFHTNSKHMDLNPK